MDDDFEALDANLQTIQSILNEQPLLALERVQKLLADEPIISIDEEKADERLLRYRYELTWLATEAAICTGNDALAEQLGRAALLDARMIGDKHRIILASLHLCYVGSWVEFAARRNQLLDEVSQLLTELDEVPQELLLEVALARTQVAMQLEDLERLERELPVLEKRIQAQDSGLQRNDKARYQLALMHFFRSFKYRMQGKLEIALQNCRDALNIFQEINHATGQSRCHLFISILLLMLGKTTESDAMVHAGLKVNKLVGNPNYQGSLLMLLAIAARRNGKLHDAMRYLERCVEIFEDNEDTLNLVNCLNNIADVCNARGEYGSALKSGFKALDLITTLGSGALRAEVTLHHIGLAYMQLGDYEQSLKYYLESIEVLHTLNHPELKIQSLGVVGRLYQRMQDFDRAEEYFRQGLQESQTFDNPRLKREMRLNMANLLTERGDDGAARGYYDEALQVAGQGFEPMQTAEILRGLGQIQQRDGNTAEALSLFERALQTQESAGATEESVETRRLMGLALLKEDATSALEQLNKTLQVAQDNNLKNKLPEIFEALAQLHESQKAPHRALTYYRRYLNGMRQRFDERNAQRLTNLRALHEVDEARREAEVLQLKNEHLRSDIATKEQELTSKALFVSNKNDLLKKLRHKLVQAQHGPSNVLSRSVAEVLRTIDDSINDKGDWLQLDERLNSTHRDFLQKVSQLYPRMSPTELRVCSLIRLNCATKDIAQIMNVSTRSAEMYRYRIRQKMALTPNENLHATLLSIN